MANCKQYQSLSVQEKRVMIGKISHLIQNNEFVFDEVALIIERAEDQKLFEGVKILQGIIHPYQNIKFNETKAADLRNQPLELL